MGVEICAGRVADVFEVGSIAGEEILELGRFGHALAGGGCRV